MWTLAIYLVGTGFSALAFKGGGLLVYFYATRFIAGTGIGGEYSAVNSAIDEMMPARYRGRRLPEPVEVAAYYAVAEALTNIAKYAGASAAEVEATAREDVLQVRVRDDGRGGADFGRGSGLSGLKDRIEALGGRISLHSPPGAGTTLQIALPLSGLSRLVQRSRLGRAPGSPQRPGLQADAHRPSSARMARHTPSAGADVVPLAPDAGPAAG